MNAQPLTIAISYDPIRVTGRFELRGPPGNSAWDRLLARAIGDQADTTVTIDAIELPWPKALGLLRDFGSRNQQQLLNFRFLPEGEAVERVKRFADEVRRARAAKDSLTLSMGKDEILRRLKLAGFTRRELKAFQLRDIERLLALPHGANFSVPGAGKTTVTFALHLLTRQSNQHLFVVGPRAAFPAWKDIVNECIGSDVPLDRSRSPFWKAVLKISTICFEAELPASS